MIKFYGVSDDLVEVEGPGIGSNFGNEGDEDQFFNVYGEGDSQEHDHWGPDPYTLTVFDVGDKLTVTAIFTADGTWTFGYIPYVKDGVETDSGLTTMLPNNPWPVRIEPRSSVRGYSQELQIDAPEGTKVRRIA